MSLELRQNVAWRGWLAVWLMISAVLAGLAVAKLRWWSDWDLPTGRFFFAQQMALIWGVGANACWLILSQLIKNINAWVRVGAGLMNIFVLMGVVQILLGEGSGRWGDGLNSAFQLPIFLSMTTAMLPILARLLKRGNGFDAQLGLTAGVWSVWVWAIGTVAFSSWIVLPAVMGPMVSGWMLACAQQLICLPLLAVAIRRVFPEKTGNLLEQTALIFLILFGPLAGAMACQHMPIPYFLVAIGQVGQVGVLLASALFVVSWRKIFLSHSEFNPTTLVFLRFGVIAVILKMLCEILSLIPGWNSQFQFSLVVMARDWVCYAGILLPAAWSVLLPMRGTVSAHDRRAGRCFVWGLGLVLAALFAGAGFYAKMVSDYTVEWEQVVKTFQLPALLVPVGCVVLLVAAWHLVVSPKTA